jgi:hypothetical protein
MRSDRNGNRTRNIVDLVLEAMSLMDAEDYPAPVREVHRALRSPRAADEYHASGFLCTSFRVARAGAHAHTLARCSRRIVFVTILELLTNAAAAYDFRTLSAEVLFKPGPTLSLACVWIVGQPAL